MHFGGAVRTAARNHAVHSERWRATARRLLCRPTANRRRVLVHDLQRDFRAACVFAVLALVLRRVHSSVGGAAEAHRSSARERKSPRAPSDLSDLSRKGSCSCAVRFTRARAHARPANINTSPSLCACVCASLQFITEINEQRKGNPKSLIVPNPIMRKVLFSLKLSCPLCLSWCDKLRDLVTHIEDECESVPLVCPRVRSIILLLLLLLLLLFFRLSD